MAELLLGIPVSNFAENVARDVTACIWSVIKTNFSLSTDVYFLLRVIFLERARDARARD